MTTQDMFESSRIITSKDVRTLVNLGGASNIIQHTLLKNSLFQTLYDTETKLLGYGKRANVLLCGYLAVDWLTTLSMFKKEYIDLSTPTVVGVLLDRLVILDTTLEPQDIFCILREPDTNWDDVGSNHIFRVRLVVEEEKKEGGSDV